MYSVMEFLRSFGSKATPHESRTNVSSLVPSDDHGESPTPGLSVRTPVEVLDFELAGPSQVEIETSSESRKDFLSSPAKFSRTTFVPVDQLPLNRDFRVSGRTNPTDKPSFAVGMSSSRFFQLSRDPAPVVSDFPIHQDAFVGGGDSSVRRLSGVENITTRETKRPKERNKDKEYRRLTLDRSDLPSFAPPVLGGLGSRPFDDGFNMGFHASPLPAPSPSPQGGSKGGLSGASSSGSNTSFEIRLVCEGRSVTQQVSDSLPVVYLVYEASALFGIDPDSIQLMYFSMTPVMLDRARTLLGPPRVTPNSTIFVFRFPGLPVPRNVQSSHERELQPRAPEAMPKLHSKLLGTFKLPKFDGTPKAWKQWDRDFVRFLGLHHLEHVIRERLVICCPRFGMRKI